MALSRLFHYIAFFRVRGRQALIEMLLVQSVIILLWPLVMNFHFFAFSRRNSLIFFLFYNLGSLCWAALRWHMRPENRTRWLQLLIEIEMAGVVLLEFMGTLSLFALTLNVIPFISNLFPFEGYRFFLVPTFYLMVLSSAFLFFTLRIALYIWHFWDKLRRTHLRWALTHAHLMIVVIGAGVISIVLIAIAIILNVNSNTPGSSDPVIIFPLIILPFMLFLTCVVIVFVLPPSALFSYLFARRTTRRIENLAVAASALRSGNYDTRVVVEGEDEIARLQTDFNTMAADFERTLRELQAERDNVATLLNARRELIANVSHELRTPVATVRSYLESTLSGWNEQPPPTLRQDLYVMEQQTIRLQSLINDLFTLARAEVKRLDLRCIPTHIDLLVQRVVDTMAPIVWRTSRVEVIAEIAQIASAFPQALVDESRLEQVLQNLLHNGVRHTPPGGIIVVSAHVTVQSVILQVKDTGEGIASEELTRIWERFYRTASARQQPGSGTGLGLAIVKELTEAMGGSVSVLSIQGQGTCFTLSLPLATDAWHVQTLHNTTTNILPTPN